MWVGWFIVGDKFGGLRVRFPAESCFLHFNLRLFFIFNFFPTTCKIFFMFWIISFYMYLTYKICQVHTMVLFMILEIFLWVHFFSMKKKDLEIVFLTVIKNLIQNLFLSLVNLNLSNMMLFNFFIILKNKLSFNNNVI